MSSVEEWWRWRYRGNQRLDLVTGAMAPPLGGSCRFDRAMALLVSEKRHQSGALYAQLNPAPKGKPLAGLTFRPGAADKADEP